MNFQELIYINKSISNYLLQKGPNTNNTNSALTNLGSGITDKAPVIPNKQKKAAQAAFELGGGLLIPGAGTAGALGLLKFGAESIYNKFKTPPKMYPMRTGMETTEEESRRVGLPASGSDLNKIQDVAGVAAGFTKNPNPFREMFTTYKRLPRATVSHPNMTYIDKKNIYDPSIGRVTNIRSEYPTTSISIAGDKGREVVQHIDIPRKYEVNVTKLQTEKGKEYHDFMKRYGNDAERNQNILRDIEVPGLHADNPQAAARLPLRNREARAAQPIEPESALHEKFYDPERPKTIYVPGPPRDYKEQTNVNAKSPLQQIRDFIMKH